MLTPVNHPSRYLTPQGLSFDWLLSPDHSLPSPDLTLYLSLPTSETSSREDFGQERYESRTLQDKVREQFKLVKRRVESGNGNGNGNARAGADLNGLWRDVDASGTREEVQRRIWEVVLPVLEREKGDVGRLWEDQQGGQGQ